MLAGAGARGAQGSGGGRAGGGGEGDGARGGGGSGRHVARGEHGGVWGGRAAREVTKGSKKDIFKAASVKNGRGIICCQPLHLWLPG